MRDDDFLLKWEQRVLNAEVDEIAKAPRMEDVIETGVLWASKGVLLGIAYAAITDLLADESTTKAKHAGDEERTCMSAVNAGTGSSKNQSASVTTTPRSSINEQRLVQVVEMKQDQALEMFHKKAMPNTSAGPFLR
ncbi:hypothetical protein EDD21DRAFT_415370 [Dissophora ornata]|nr:hypothetical protein BGZ58_009041 [Dissophora ornata]KAI8600951.1 hypothetical protein EDD21DRAFT_415370 [Dissophora ornata]